MLRTLATTAVLAGIVPVAALGPLAPAPARPVPARSTLARSASAFPMAARHHFGQPGNASGYAVIVATGRRRAWVFGGTNPGGQSAPVAELWNGKLAVPSALPARLSGFISDASAPSADDIWAASEYGRYVLHWDGKRWHVAKRWRGGLITGLTAIDARDVWVFGTTATGFGVMGTWHFNGQSWTAVRGLGHSIYRASAISRRDIWAISAGRQTDSLLRFNGRSWRLLRTHALKNMRPRDILALSDRDVWVVGNLAGRSDSDRLLLAHWNGRTWTTIESQMEAWAGRLARGPRGGVLITATPVAADAGLILQASPSGRLSGTGIRFGAGSGVSDVVLVDGGRSLWATGGLLTRLGGDAAIWVGHVAAGAARPDPDD